MEDIESESELLKNDNLMVNNQILEYKELMEYVLGQNPDMVIQEKSAKEKEGQEKMYKLKIRILKSLEEYDKMLKQVQDPDEARILQSTIDTLNLQLRKLELSKKKIVPEDNKIEIKLDELQDEIRHINEML